MKADPVIRIATHCGSFHADDVLSMAILTTLFPNHQVIRTRDQALLDLMDIVVDVGGVYDHKARRFDHHMRHPPADKSGHLYSSAGLIWKHYGRAYLKEIGLPSSVTISDFQLALIDSVDVEIRNKWIYPIDRADNGAEQGLTPISEIVRALRPIDPEKSRARFDALFLEAVSMVSHILKRTCFHYADYAIAKVRCNKSRKELVLDGEIMVVSEPVYNFKYFKSTNAHFVISPHREYKDSEPSFIIRPIVDSKTNLYRSNFPIELLGASREKIESLQIEGISFIHHCGFMSIADTKEAAVDFCKQILKK